MSRFLLLCIFTLAVCLRFFHLGSVPVGFIPEEVSTGWSAYSLLKTGADEWGIRWPIIFRETGGYKLILNGYAMVPVLALLGLTEFAVRFTTAGAGVLAVLLTYPVARLLLRSRCAALLAALLLAINPWHVSMSRYGVDVNWGLALFLAGVWCFLSSFEQRHFLILSGIFFSLTYYTYFNYIVFTVLFLGFLLFLHRRRLWERRMRGYLAAFLFVQIAAFLPYLAGNNLFTRFSQATSVQSIGLLNNINEHRGACLARAYPAVFCRVMYNRPLIRGQEMVRSWVNHVSTTTFFLYGSNRGLSGMPQGWGLLYLVEFPFIVTGAVLLVQRRKFPMLIAGWLLLWAIPSSLAGDGHVWRMMTVLPVPQMIGGYGLAVILNRVRLGEGSRPIPRHQRDSSSLRLLRMTTSLFLLFIVVFSFLQFLTDYFGYFPYAQAGYSYYGFRDLYAYLRTIDDRYDHVVIAPVGMGFNQLYIYYLFYQRFDPVSFQAGIDVDRRVGEQGWVWVDRIGKYYFVGEKDKVRFPLSERTLLVMDATKEETLLAGTRLAAKPLRMISYPNGDPAFVIMELVKLNPGL